MRPQPDIHARGQGSASWPTVAIVILNWNGWRETVECLESLRASTYPRSQVIVVDNGSTDESPAQLRAWVRRHGEGVALVEHGENLGFGGGVNAGIRRALVAPSPADFVFLLNNDARVAASAVTQCVRVSNEEDAAIVGAVIRSADGVEVLFAGARFPRELFGRAIVTTNAADGQHGCWPSARAEASGMLIRRDVIDARLREVGHVLDPGLFMYCEETDLCEWARARSYRIVIAGGAVVYHGLGRSAGGWGSPLMHYYLTRNRILLARRLLPTHQRLAFHLWFPPSRMLRAAERFLRGHPSVASAIVHGLWDGYRGVTGRWAKHPRHRDG